MIPRFKPEIGINELAAVMKFPDINEIYLFEKEFAKIAGQKHALSFPYGRTGLMLLLEALDLKNKEIICPAYTCVVVPHAVVFSGNKPVFIDCSDHEFNMNLEEVEKQITKKTGAIIVTSLFGYPVDLDKLDEIREKYPEIKIIQDCAHSFFAEWKGRPVHKSGIAAVYGLNISKLIISVFGGMISTNNTELYIKLKTLRDHTLRGAGKLKGLRRFLYLLSVYPVFWNPVYSMLNRLERSGLIDYFIKYYDDLKIDMPKDFLKKMTPVEAAVGRANIHKYHCIIEKHKAAAKYYLSHLKNTPEITLPPLIKGATFSHFVVLVKNREDWLFKGKKNNVELGRVIEYSIPEMKAYGGHSQKKFPLAGRYARTAINFPVWGGEKLSREILNRLL